MTIEFGYMVTMGRSSDISTFVTMTQFSRLQQDITCEILQFTPCVYNISKSILRMVFELWYMWWPFIKSQMYQLLVTFAKFSVIDCFATCVHKLSKSFSAVTVSGFQILIYGDHSVSHWLFALLANFGK